MTEPHVLLDGLGFPESTRWRDGRVWLCDWGSGRVLALDPDDPSGAPEVCARLDARALPFSIDWLPDGELVVVDGPGRRLLTRPPGDDPGALEPYADLAGFGDSPVNEIVVDGAGRAYVNGSGGRILLITADGAATVVADGLAFPNGMALLDGDRTLVVADSHAERLLGYAVEPDGRLGAPTTWAELAHAPDGICADADGAVWVATVPGRRCQRVHEGGRVSDEVATDRGCFSCMLGGGDGRTLYVAAAQWRGMEAAMTEGPGTTGRLLAAPGRPAPHAGRP